MQAKQLSIWNWIHKWTSLVCTLFLLMLCITGLPLTFHDEIDNALNPETWQAKHPNGPLLSLDALIDVAKQNRPEEVPIFMSFDTQRPVVNVTTGPSGDAANNLMYFASFDATSGELVPPSDVGEGVMEFILQLHTDMFLGLPGMYLLAFMGILFILATISGVVLYRQFMRNLPFGTLRKAKKRRLRWLDYHNFLGVITLAWVLVVGITGVINALEAPILETWRDNNINQLVREHQTMAASDTELANIVNPVASLQVAVDEAKRAAPDMTLQFVAFPGSSFSSNAHYAIFLHGNTPMTKELITPVLVDAISGEVKGLSEMPWYMQALSLSRPLHFGDYGGIFLKLIWTALNLMTIFVLITGIYLWYIKYRAGVVKNELAHAS